MYNWIKEFLLNMQNAHLIDEAYIELDMDNELGKGEL